MCSQVFSTTTLSPSSEVLTIATKAMVHSLVLLHSTRLEWSGYGPVRREGEGRYRLLDFYLLSTSDDSGSTEIDPSAGPGVAAAWERVMADGIDPFKDNITMAWVHCHPFGRTGNWSAQDEQAIKDCLDHQRKANAEQISVLFFDGGPPIARVDGYRGRMHLHVTIDWGEWSADREKLAVAKAEKDARMRATIATTPLWSGWGWGSVGMGMRVALSTCEICQEYTAVLHVCDRCHRMMCRECSTIGDRADQFLCVECAVKSAFSEAVCYMCGRDASYECEMCGEAVCEAHRGYVGANLCLGCFNEIMEALDAEAEISGPRKSGGRKRRKDRRHRLRGDW